MELNYSTYKIDGEVKIRLTESGMSSLPPETIPEVYIKDIRISH